MPLPDFHFRFMAFWYRIRDILAPRTEILREVGIQAGCRVLDFGCGPGSYILPLSRLTGPEGKVYAMDLHPLAIKRARTIIQKEHLNNVEVIQSDGNTGLVEESVDFVLLYEVFHDLSEPKRILRELVRVLKPEGLLSVIDQYIPEETMLFGITQEGFFHLMRKGKMTYSFSKNRSLL